MNAAPQRLTFWDIALPVATVSTLVIGLLFLSPLFALAFGLFCFGVLCIFIAPACITYFISSRVRESRIIPPHCCQKCRYDRTGIDPSDACPECGRI